MAFNIFFFLNTVDFSFAEILFLRILIFIQFGRQEESKFGIGLDVQFYGFGSPVRHILEGIGEEVEIDFLQQIPNREPASD